MRLSAIKERMRLLFHAKYAAVSGLIVSALLVAFLIGQVGSSPWAFAFNSPPTPPPNPPQATDTPLSTPMGCQPTSPSTSQPTQLAPSGTMGYWPTYLAFVYNSASNAAGIAYRYEVKNSGGTLTIFDSGQVNLALTVGCAYDINFDASITFAASTTYQLWVGSYTAGPTFSGFTTTSFTTPAANATPTPAISQPGGGGVPQQLPTTISYACGLPPVIDGSDGRGGIPSIIKWIWCQTQHFDLTAPFEGLIDPAVGGFFGWFKNWNNAVGPIWTDLNNLSNNLVNTWHQIAAVGDQITHTLINNVTAPVDSVINAFRTAINTVINNFKIDAHSMLSWVQSTIQTGFNSALSAIGNAVQPMINFFVPHSSDFVPLQSVGAAIYAREPFHFGLVFIDTMANISNQFWSAAGLAGTLPSIASNGSFGCVNLPNDVASPTAPAGTPATGPSWPTLPTTAPVDTPIPIEPTATVVPWPTPAWLAQAPAHPAVHQMGPIDILPTPGSVGPTPTPNPTPSTYTCTTVNSGQIPSAAGASSGGDLPSVPSLVPSATNPDGSPAYVANPLSGTPTAAASYGSLSSGITMFLDLLSHMGISRDNFAKIVDLFIIIATLVGIGRDLGVRAGMLSHGNSGGGD